MNCSFIYIAASVKIFTMRENLFAGAQASSKADWLVQIQKELKGKPLESLDWQVEEHIRLAPLYAREDLSRQPPLAGGRTDNNWEVGELIEVRDLAAANQQVHKAIAAGISAPLFQLHHEPTAAELGILASGIVPDNISVHFALQHPGKDPAEFYRDLIYYVRQQGYRLSAIRGSVDFDPLLDWSEPPLKPLARILGFARRQTPLFKVLQVNARTFDAGLEHTSRELALTIAKGVTYLDLMEKEGVPPAITNAHMQFALTIGNTYFANIAKIRALRLLWANVLEAYELASPQLPPIVVHLEDESQTDDMHTNMIRAAAQAMSAVIGGASRLYVLSADQYAQPDTSGDFVLRIARNVQHLLRYESGFDKVVDPAAGSYFLDTFTEALAAEAWQKFLHIEEQGGFWEAMSV